MRPIPPVLCGVLSVPIVRCRMAGRLGAEGSRIAHSIRASNCGDYLYRVVPKSYKWVSFTAKCPLKDYAIFPNIVKGFFLCIVRSLNVRYVVYCMEEGSTIGYHFHGIACIQGRVPSGTVDKCFLRWFWHRQLSHNLAASFWRKLPYGSSSALPVRRSLPSPLGWIWYMVKHGPVLFLTAPKVLRRRSKTLPSNNAQRLQQLIMEGDIEAETIDTP